MKLNFKGFGELSLCDKCQHSQIQITSQGDRIVKCSAMFATATQRVPPNIAECNKFLPVGTPSQHDMEKQAWILEVNKGQPMGFKPPKPDK